MDWQHPERAWADAVSGPVLSVLWRAGRPLSGKRVHELAGVGAYSTVRAALLRLVEHGIVTADRAGGSVMYVLNRDHLTYPALDAALRATTPWDALRTRTAALVGTHYPEGGAGSPTVVIFGSVARGDARLDSDIDVLLVVPDSESDAAQRLADALTDRFRTWTGQPAHVYLTTQDRLLVAARASDPVIASFRQDGVLLTGPQLTWPTAVAS